MKPHERRLAECLLCAYFAEQQGDYDWRNRVLKFALAEAAACGYRAGFRNDPAEPEWPVLFIELPTGQVSWHLPQHEIEWDGHDTDEKWRRCWQFNTEHGL